MPSWEKAFGGKKRKASRNVKGKGGEPVGIAFLSNRKDRSQGSALGAVT